MANNSSEHDDHFSEMLGGSAEGQFGGSTLNSGGMFGMSSTFGAFNAPSTTTSQHARSYSGAAPVAPTLPRSPPLFSNASSAQPYTAETFGHAAAFASPYTDSPHTAASPISGNIQSPSSADLPEIPEIADSSPASYVAGDIDDDLPEPGIHSSKELFAHSYTAADTAIADANALLAGLDSATQSSMS
ncbi:hypothetical protein THASP1DRAFT_25825, partial [Thamnocephalis sphaerospora]